MKIAFLHARNFFASEFLRHFRTALAHHEVVEWLNRKDAPAFDFDVLLAMGKAGRELLLVQPQSPQPAEDPARSHRSVRIRMT
jgi:hypothetical protein